MTTEAHDPQQQPYYRLSPDTVIDATESLDLISDYRILALNSFENRVYQVGIEGAEPVIVKFYRPNRWSDASIIEEHNFTTTLSEADLPVIAPLSFQGQTLHRFQDYRFALYPRRGGHPISVDNLDVLYRMGQFLGRIHAIGAVSTFTHRSSLSVVAEMTEDMAFLQEHFIADDLLNAYRSLGADLINTVEHRLAEIPPLPFLRLHGDCHAGNVLWRDDHPWFLDFDDCLNGPAIQDLWMLLWGSRAEQAQQLAEIRDGYNEFNTFEASQLGWIEILRTRRMVQQAAWIARRWNDPAFPRAFTWFNTPRYWPDHILQLREQLAALQEAPISLWPS